MTMTSSSLISAAPRLGGADHAGGLRQHRSILGVRPHRSPIRYPWSSHCARAGIIGHSGQEAVRLARRRPLADLPDEMQLDAGRAAVTGAIAPLEDFSRWVRGELLVIVLLVLGAILLTRLAGWVRDKIMAHIDARAIETDELVRSEAAKHRHVVAQVVTWTALAVIYVVTAVLVVQRLGVPLAGLVAPAALLSAALGFGLQRFVQDIGAGLFITGERQYGFGDVVQIAVGGGTPPVTGTVEDVTLRVTRLRTLSGEVITTPNGQIIQVTNLSRDWARAVLDVPVPSAVDVSHVTDVLKRVGEEAYNDDRLRKMMLDPPSVMGVERIEVDTFSVRMVARTLPGIQFDVGRELRARVASAFRYEGINVSAELDTGRATGGAS